MTGKRYHLAYLPPDLIAMMRGDYAPNVFARAVAAQVKRGLCYDDATGTLYRDGRWLSRFVNPSDHTPAQNLTQVAFAMQGTVRNSCSRIVRGFEP